MAYTPEVGRTYTPNDFAGMTDQQILSRPINDPAFTDTAVGSARFDWRPYFALRFDDKAFEARVIAEMDGFASTPEGRQSLRQAVAMQQLRVADGDYRQALTSGQIGADMPEALKPDPQGRIVLCDHPKMLSFTSDTGVLALDPTRIGSTRYHGTDGQDHPATLGFIMYHELGHAKDPLNRGASASANDMLTKRYYNNCSELPVFIDSNQYVSTNMGLVPRALNHDALASPAVAAAPEKPVEVSQADLMELAAPTFPASAARGGTSRTHG